MVVFAFLLVCGREKKYFEDMCFWLNGYFVEGPFSEIQ